MVVKWLCFAKHSILAFYAVVKKIKKSQNRIFEHRIFFSDHFLMPLGIPFQKYMVSIYFLASQTHHTFKTLWDAAYNYCIDLAIWCVL